MSLLTKEKQQWQNIFQQKHTATTEVSVAHSDSGAVLTAIVV
jgi:hypothetical protein